jgi:membrane protease YdiL (CAAX protease family)
LRWEIVFVLLTGLGQFLLAGWLELQLAYVLGACLFWAGFVVIRAKSDASVLTDWGFRTRGFGRSMAFLAPAILLTTFGFAAYGKLTGSMMLNWHILLICLIYPFWGLVQQFLIVALLAGNMRKHSRIPGAVIVLLTALIFAGVHAPSLPLMGAAFVLALVTTMVYFRTRNLWALGIFHGWFATGLYFLVLGRDPWTVVFSGRGWP